MKTCILRDKRKGRGLYAKTEIRKGELIEACELILIDMNDVNGALEGYVYGYSKNKAALALGNGSLLNHSDRSNSEFYFDYRRKKLLIRAKRRIRPGEEITINYGYNEELKKRFNIT